MTPSSIAGAETLVEELRGRSANFKLGGLRLGGPSDEHTGLLLERAADALEAMGCDLAEALARGDEYERLYRQSHLDYVSAEYKLESTQRSLSSTQDELRRVREALEEIASHDCGCVPCTGQCRKGEAAEIELEERMAIARAALAPREEG